MSSRARFASEDASVIRSTTDSFHRPRAARLKRGPTSADGYFLDSHQVDRIVNELLVPFREGAGEVLVAAFDEPTDTPLEIVTDVAPNAVLVFDGLFVHRDEFAKLWDVSVFLDADERRGAEWLEFLLDDLPTDSTQRAAELDRRLDTRPMAPLPARLVLLHRPPCTATPRNRCHRQQRPRPPTNTPGVIGHGAAVQSRHSGMVWTGATCTSAVV